MMCRLRYIGNAYSTKDVKRHLETIQNMILPPSPCALEPPALIAPFRPSYPEVSFAEGAVASVEVRVSLGIEGQVLAAVKEDMRNRYAGLDEAAIDAARRSRFKPAFCNDTAVRSSYRFVVNFNIDSRTHRAVVTIGDPAWQGPYQH